MEKILNMILAEQKRQGDLLLQLINTVAATNVEVTGINGEVTKINGEIAKMNREIIGINGEIVKTNGEITEIKGKIATFETKLDSVIEDVKEIKASMATKHDLEYYDQMISEHSRQIYKLKNH